MRTTFSQRFTYLFGPSMKRQRLLLAFALLMLASSAWAADQGYFGFSVAVDGEGFFLNPTLKSIKIEKVASFKQPVYGKWLPFELEATAERIAFRIADQSGTIDGPIDMDGRNWIGLATGSKLKDVRIEVISNAAPRQ